MEEKIIEYNFSNFFALVCYNAGKSVDDDKKKIPSFTSYTTPHPGKLEGEPVPSNYMKAKKRKRQSKDASTKSKKSRGASDTTVEDKKFGQKNILGRPMPKKNKLLAL